MCDAHAAPYSNIKSSQLALSIDNGNEPKIICKYVNVVCWWYSNGYLKLNKRSVLSEYEL